MFSLYIHIRNIYIHSHTHIRTNTRTRARAISFFSYPCPKASMFSSMCVYMYIIFFFFLEIFQYLRFLVVFFQTKLYDLYFIQCCFAEEKNKSLFVVIHLRR
uniref:Uncharacterized protein n=1 Tax=Octopus bimaculoides TaxID=37653 RepID=A0A0L8FTM0_OCTBM